MSVEAERQRAYLERKRRGQVKPRQASDEAPAPKRDTLLEALIAAVASPRLPDAACIGRHDLFDPPADGGEDSDALAFRYRSAREICGSCAEFAACESWVDSLPPRQRPPGIIAGRLVIKAEKKSRIPKGNRGNEHD